MITIEKNKNETYRIELRDNGFVKKGFAAVMKTDISGLIDELIKGL